MSLERLCEELDRHPPLAGLDECSGCLIKCRRKMRVHWLLADEAEKFKGRLPISKIGEAHFFDGGQCPLLQDGKCATYGERPLECRLNPLSVLEISGELHWIIYPECSAVHGKPLTGLVDSIKPILRGLAPHLTGIMRQELSCISKAIIRFDPMVPGRDFLVLEKI